MIIYLIITVFVVGFALITLEHSIDVNKAGTALLTGALLWSIVAVSGPHGIETVLHHLEKHVYDIASIVFFLISAMVIVELIDAHDGFDVITNFIKTQDKRKLLWVISLITFFLSALLDNLTTTIVMVSMLRKLVDDRQERLLFAGIIVIAANAGGAWSPLGDVTTTMLWIGNQITAPSVVKMLLLPSLVCLTVPLFILSMRTKGKIKPKVTLETEETSNMPPSTPYERNAVLFLGIACLIMVPIFKTVTHLPPFMGMLLGLGIIWVVTERIHHEKDEGEKGQLSVLHALRKADVPSILFFTGILLAVAALETVGVLHNLATFLDTTLQDERLIVLSIGFISAIVDNVPLVAAAQGMYPLSKYPTDSFFWEFLAYCTGTGGSALIIGSAAGVAAMGLEKIDFFWYFKNITPWAVIGYLSGAACYLMVYSFLS